MEVLEQRILAEGRNLGQGILKVDSFVNHQVDSALMLTCGQEFARLFQDAKPTKVLTAEISGIAPALMTGLALNIPVVYARKTKPITMPDTVFLTTAPSHTKKRDVEIMASPEYLQAGERVLIVDDFLATGQTILALARLAKAAGAEIVGVGALIEKSFEGGREALKSLGVPVRSLAVITDMRNGKFVFDHSEQ
jgi:xanthine phosphoribosyltransferase